MICTAIEAVPGVRSLRGHPGTELALATVEDRVVELAASSATRLPGVRIELDLADAVGHWHPGLPGARTLPPDWVGPSETSLVQLSGSARSTTQPGRSCSMGSERGSR